MTKRRKRPGPTKIFEAMMAGEPCLVCKARGVSVYTIRKWSNKTGDRAKYKNVRKNCYARKGTGYVVT